MADIKKAKQDATLIAENIQSLIDKSLTDFREAHPELDINIHVSRGFGSDRTVAASYVVIRGNETKSSSQVVDTITRQ